MKHQSFQRGDRVSTIRQLGFLPPRSSGTIMRSFVHSDLCAVHFDQRAEPHIMSRNDLEIVAARASTAANHLYLGQEERL